MTFATKPKGVLMVGTALDTMGGISTVVRQYLAGGLFERFEGTYVATHKDGSALEKVSLAALGWLRVLKHLAGGEISLVHIHLSSRASFWRKSVICLIARAMRRPYLLHVHGSEFMRFFEDECGPQAKRYVRWIFNHAVLVLALSEQWRVGLLRICPTARIEVLPNAVQIPDVRMIPRDANAAREILFLGRLGQRKGAFDLVRAFANIAQRFPTARLVCAGDGEVAAIRKLAAELRVEDRIECPGWLSHEAANRRLASAELFILPSYAEGLPMALLEAMSWAVPVIASPVGGIPQVIRHGDNGLLVSAGDVDGLAEAMSRVLSDGELRHRLGDQARSTVETSFSLDKSLAQLGQIYDRCGVTRRTRASHA